MAAASDDMSRLRGKKAIRSFTRKLGEIDTIRDLNIVPMMDMMTIILVFLLKSFSSSTDLLQIPADMQLPRSQTHLEPKQAVQVTISKSYVVIDGEPITPIIAGRIDPKYKKDGTENSYLVPNIQSWLEGIKKREQRVAELQHATFEGELMVVADKSTPYRLLMDVINSCGQAGYAKYRLLVLKNGE